MSGRLFPVKFRGRDIIPLLYYGMNYIVLLIFAPLLVLTGLLGFLIPKDKSLTSGAVPYNIFHIIFGLVGLLCVWTQNETYIRGFIVGFGLIDLYQAVASYLHIFPEKYFQWTRVDDVLHLVIGIALIGIGVLE